jgi:hypothetical protein
MHVDPLPGFDAPDSFRRRHNHLSVPVRPAHNPIFRSAK